MLLKFSTGSFSYICFVFYFFQHFGEVLALTHDETVPSILVEYKTRQEAEQVTIPISRSCPAIMIYTLEY